MCINKCVWITKPDLHLKCSWQFCVMNLDILDSQSKFLFLSTQTKEQRYLSAVKSRNTAWGTATPPGKEIKMFTVGPNWRIWRKEPRILFLTAQSQSVNLYPDRNKTLMSLECSLITPVAESLFSQTGEESGQSYASLSTQLLFLKDSESCSRFTYRRAVEYFRLMYARMKQSLTAWMHLQKAWATYSWIKGMTR